MPDTYLKCTECGRESTTDFASSLRTGWEKCCGYTMRLERTDADVEAKAGELFGQITDVLGAARRA
jgi:hypothetical protein